MDKVVLLIDNTPTFLDVQSRLLEQAGYRVVRASNLEEAEAQLEARHIHLAICDIRMEDENDAQDISGLVLARKVEYRAIPKIILTAYPSRKNMREALVADLGSPSLAVDFVSKEDDPDVLMQAVERAFAQYVRINHTLIIHCEGACSFHYLLTLIEPEIASANLSERACELESLFRMLSYDYTQITLGRVLAAKPGRVLLEVFAYRNEHRAGQFVFCCGQKQRMTQEDRGYDSSVPKGIGIGRTSKEATAETLHFAATAYTLIGVDCEEVVSFRTFYHSRSIEEVLASLDHLYKTTLDPWHGHSRFRIEDRTLSDLYLEWLGLSVETLVQDELEHRMKAICTETLAAGLTHHLIYSQAERTLQLSDGSLFSYPAPIPKLHEVRGANVPPALCGVTHGGIDPDAVLVNMKGEIWLIDFSQVGRGLLLRDFVLMETAIKLELLKSSDLLERHSLEQLLLEAAELDTSLAIEEFPPELQYALRSIERIRGLAATMAGADRKSYLYGLFFCAMRRIIDYDPSRQHIRRELVPYAHSLLLAAMIYETLRRTDIPTDIDYQARTSLWIDETNKEVWVEGRSVDLTPTELRILEYLYEHANRLCSRQSITKVVWGDDYTLAEEGRFNSAMSRLRQKVEPDPDLHKYIITDRGQGFKLKLEKPT